MISNDELSKTYLCILSDGDNYYGRVVDEKGNFIKNIKYSKKDKYSKQSVAFKELYNALDESNKGNIDYYTKALSKEKQKFYFGREVINPKDAITIIKNSKPAQKLFAGLLAATIATTSASALAACKVKDAKPQISTSQGTNDERNKDQSLDIDRNSITFDEYLNSYSSTNEIIQQKINRQKQVLYMMSEYTNYFNIDFANRYLESNKNIKASLNWRYEIPALTIAYNNFSEEDLIAIFNGARFNSSELKNSYNSALIELMGAYIISESDMRVKLEDLIESQEGKAFVAKYEGLFYAIKNATTEEEELQRIHAFYQEFRNDYLNTEINSECGITYTEEETKIENGYMLAVIPMLFAAENMYQNKKIDYTLTDEEFKRITMSNNI